MKINVLSLAALLVMSCAAPPPDPAPRQPDEELSGRVAGAPERCVLIQSGEGLRISESDPHTLLYGHGKTIWANNLGGECSLSSNDILVAEPIAPYHCRGDLIRSFDRISRMQGPACVLRDFVPYTR